MEMTSRKNDLTEGVVWKKLLRFFFPILLGLLFQQLYNTVDAVIVGRFVGDAALAAVGGGSSSLINLILGFFTGLNCGATVLISQFFGAKDDDNLSDVLHTAVVFCLIVGLAVMVTGFIIAPKALEIINTPEDIMEDSITYLRIYFLGSVPLLLYNLCQGTLQSVGDSRRPLVYLIISCLANIALDTVFVAVLKMGVAGVAWASVISMVLCTGMALVHLTRVQTGCRIRMNRLKLTKSVLKRMMRIGLPSGFQGTMYSISNLIITASVNSFGTGVAAAWTATGKLDGVYWVTVTAFGTAVCAFVGQCYGAGKIERMKQAIGIGLKIALGTTVVLSVAILAVAPKAFPLFLTAQEVVDQAVELLWYFVPFYWIWTFVEILSGTFRGVGDTFRPMVIVMLCSCVFRIIWMLLVVSRWHTIFMVSIVYVVSWTITAIVFGVYYFKGKWMREKA